MRGPLSFSTPNGRNFSLFVALLWPREVNSLEMEMRRVKDEFECDFVQTLRILTVTHGET